MKKLNLEDNKIQLNNLIELFNNPQFEYFVTWLGDTERELYTKLLNTFSTNDILDYKSKLKFINDLKDNIYQIKQIKNH